MISRDLVAQAVSTPLSEAEIKSFTLVVPTLNEANSLSSFLEDVLSTFPGLKIYFVDDGSTDASLDKIKEFKVNRIDADVIFDQSRDYTNKPGLGNALIHGIFKVTTKYYVCMDADGQHDIHVLDRMMRLLRSNTCKITNTYRTGRLNYGFGRHTLSLITRGLMRLNGKRNRSSQETYLIRNNGTIIEKDVYGDVSSFFGGTTEESHQILKRIDHDIGLFTKPSVYLLRDHPGCLIDVEFQIKERKNDATKLNRKTCFSCVRWFLRWLRYQ